MLLIGGSLISAFYAAGHYYEGWWYRSQYTAHVPEDELAFDVWFAMYGGALIALWAVGLHWSGLSRVLSRVIGVVRRARGLPTLLIVLCVAASIAVRRWVLHGEIIADDESVYRFIAQTLLHGRIVNPVPGDPLLFHSQFVVANARGWFGMYPIGHPLLLAAGMTLHLDQVLIPGARRRRSYSVVDLASGATGGGTYSGIGGSLPYW